MIEKYIMSLAPSTDQVISTPRRARRTKHYESQYDFHNRLLTRCEDRIEELGMLDNISRDEKMTHLQNIELLANTVLAQTEEEDLIKRAQAALQYSREQMLEA
ncbi:MULTISPECIES: hypothetical protein [Pseudomonas]|jgi:hypothetical protein|uniref:Uncharacterized protein n=3 Tax=Pseudomonas TaxID=286 RepID=A0ABS0FQ70_PSELU|nr:MULTISPECIES: hypothetical protein [Pseudomonas]MBF8642519.1 hypothetical protein [Pseudomonas zeshuii]MCG7374615.1 hypothetical protein [Pseudomonas luteola]RRW46437.1 hypothetical protein EGJ50_13190 [Pseudomonas luteola]